MDGRSTSNTKEEISENDEGTNDSGDTVGTELTLADLCTSPDRYGSPFPHRK